MKSSRASRAARFILIISALLLPTLSLLPLGGLYLLEKGWLLWWAIGAAATISIVFVAQKYLLASPEFDKSDPVDPAGAAAATVTVPSSAANPNWTAAEQRAWADVLAIAARVNPDKLTSSKAVFDLGHHTVNVVAKRMHPTKSDALWQFTMPEALAITERVSQRLGRFIEDTIPFGDRLTVSQVLTVYSWRSVADVAEKAYDIWRIVRLANPATAITHEARERLSRAMVAWGKDHVARQIAETFVLEVGRAAIDLYGGRLRISRDDILDSKFDATTVTGASGGGPPLTILVTGPARGRVENLTAALQAMRHERAEKIAAFVRGDASHSGLISLTAIDIIASHAPGAAASPSSARDLASLARDARTADLVLWVQNDMTPPDDYQLRELRAVMAADMPVPPVLLPVIYAAGADGIPASAETQALTKALMVALRAEYAGGHVSNPIMLRGEQLQQDPSVMLWPAVAAVAEEARRVQFARALDAARNRRDWTGAARQAASAAGALAKSMLPGRTNKP